MQCHVSSHYQPTLYGDVIVINIIIIEGVEQYSFCERFLMHLMKPKNVGPRPHISRSQYRFSTQNITVTQGIIGITTESNAMTKILILMKIMF